MAAGGAGAGLVLPPRGGVALAVLPPGGGGIVITALPAGLLARLPNLIRIDFSGRDEGARAACTPVLVASLGPLSTALLTGSLRDVAFRGAQVRDEGTRAACTPVLVASLGPLSTALLTGSLQDIAFRGTQVKRQGRSTHVWPPAAFGFKGIVAL